MKEILEKRGRKITHNSPWHNCFHFLCMHCLQTFSFKCPHVYTAPILVLTTLKRSSKITSQDSFLRPQATPSLCAITFLTLWVSLFVFTSSPGTKFPGGRSCIPWVSVARAQGRAHAGHFSWSHFCILCCYRALEQTPFPLLLCSFHNDHF